MAQAEVRYIEETIGETGTADRVEGYYEIGFMKDGGWFPFQRKQASYVEHIAGNNKERASASSSNETQSESQSQSNTASTSTPVAQPGDQGGQAASDQAQSQGGDAA